MSKRILSLLLAFTLTLTLFVGITVSADSFTDTVDTKYHVAADVLETLGIARGYLDGTYDILGKMTKAEFCYIISSITNMSDFVDENTVYWADVKKDHWAYKYINYATVMGLTEGNGIYYYPDMKITGNEIAKALVKLLNYEFKVSNGNYIAVASDIGVLKGVVFNANSSMTRGDILLAVYNAVQVEMPVMSGVSNLYGTDYELTGETLLSYYKDIYKGRGQVTAVGKLNLFASFANTKETDVRINNVLFTGADTFDASLFGYEVDYFYSYNEKDDVSTILTAHATAKNDVVSFKASQIESVSDDYVLYYYNDPSSPKTSKQEISTGAKFVYNGRVIPESRKSAALLEFESGDITIITPDKGTEVVIVNQYDYYIIDSVGNEELILLDDTYNDAGEKIATGTINIPLDDDSDDYEFDIISNGVVASFNDFIAGTGVGVSYSWDMNDKPYTRITILTNSVSGVLSGFSTDTVTINDVTYNRMSSVKNINLKNTFTLYLDEEQTVVLASAAAVSGVNYGYLVEAAVAGDLAKTTDIKILKADGEYQIFSLNENYNINDTPVKYKQNPIGDASNPASNFFVLENGVYYTYPQVIAYTLKENGKIADIYTAQGFVKDDSGNVIVDEYGAKLQDDEKPLYLSYEFDGVETLKYKGGSGKQTFNGQFYLNATGVFFKAPTLKPPYGTDEETGKTFAELEEEDFQVLTWNDFANDTNYKLNCYNSNAGGGCEIIVNLSSSGGASMNFPEQTMKVCDRVTKISDNGDITYKVYYWDAGALTNKIFAIGEGENYEKSLAAIKGMKRGDVFLIEETGGGNIKNLEIKFSPENPQPITLWNKNPGFVFGQVAARVSTGEVAIFATDFDEDDNLVVDKSRQYVYRGMERNTIYLYTGEDDEITTLANTDIKVGDWVITRERFAQSQEWLVVRNED